LSIPLRRFSASRTKPKEVPIVNREKDKKQSIKLESKNQEVLMANALTRIESLEKEIKAIDLAMSDDQIGFEELTMLYSKKIDLGKELDSVMELWIS
jgi:ATP-binding cassette, subfamily F, member 3